MPVSRRSPTRSRSDRVLLETLEARTLLSSAPLGSVDLLSRTQVTGWSYNADDGAAALNIDITINGVKTTLAANQSRMDLASCLGSPYHGFSFTMPALAPGSTNVLVEAVSVSSGARTTLRSGVLTNPAPTGAIQTATATRITGWAYDPDAAGPVSLRLDLDGVAGTPFAASIARADIATPRGYNTTTLGFDLSGAYAGHVVELFALDAPTGAATLLYTNNTKPIGSVDVNNGSIVSGWVVDLDNKAAAINVYVEIDGVTLAGTPTPASNSRPDLAGALGSANHGFSINIPGLRPGSHTISVYASDGQASSQAPVLLGSRVVTNAPPVGAVDAVSGTSVAGWALDPDLGAAAATVHVYVDQQAFASVSAALPRPSLTSTYGSPNHGFSVNLSSLPAGSHAITVTVSDNLISDQDEVVIYDGFINNHPPVGSFDSVTGAMIYGWAYDQDAPGQAISVDVYVDGSFATTFQADQARGDLDAVLPTPHHAFAHALPAVGFGTHRIDVYAAEAQGNVSVLIGSKTVVNNRPLGCLDVASATTIGGWAVDIDRPGESADLRVYINGTLALTQSTNVNRADIAAIPPLSMVPGFSAYGFSITLPTLAAGRNQIDVFMADINNGLLTPLASRVITI